jgi:YD repeat-containing protein
MGTQGDGGRVALFAHEAKIRRLSQRVSATLLSFVGLLAVVFVLWVGVVHAQTTNYVYDANGRVVAISQNNGPAVQYSYDTLGHLAQTTTVAAGQLAIFAFVPTQGEAGTQVTIEGQGFSISPASNTVSFNGTPATVLSASAAQIVTTVPTGATTGPISVTVNGQTTTSAAAFVVDSNGMSPTISTVSPLILTSGGVVTVTGTNLDPTSGNTAVEIGDSEVQLSAASNTQLQVATSDVTSSGFLTVQTTYGEATSASPLIILPTTVSPSLVAGEGFADVNGAGLNFNIPSGQLGAMVFNGAAGQWLSILASGMTLSSGTISYNVYGPGNVLIQQGTISTTSPSIHLPELMATGAYLVTFQPSSANAQFSAQITSDATLSFGSAVSSSTTTAGQTVRFIFNDTDSFNASNGGNLELEFTGANVSGGSQNQLSAQIINAAGSVISSTTCEGPSSTANYCHLSLWNTVAGTYSIVVGPVNGGTISFNTVLQADIVGSALTLGTPLAVNMTAGQMQRVTFNATAGQTVALSFSNVSTTPAGQFLAVFLYAPNSGALTATNYYSFLTSSSSSTFNLSNLPTTGTYTLVIGSAESVPVTGQLTVFPGVTGTVPTNGTSQNYSTSVSGQNVYLNFSATAGENLELELTDCSADIEVQVSNANGTVVGGTSCEGPGSASNYVHLSLWNMAAGTYSMVVYPSNGGTMSFNTILQPDIIGPALTPNTPLAVNMTAGQMERVTFSGTAGQSVALSFSNISTTPAGQLLAAYVFAPNTATLTASDYYTFLSTSSPNTFTLSNLPTTGTYTLVIGSSESVPVSGQITLVPQ